MGIYMESRKVQETGGATYIVSLPKKWVRDTGIKKKDTINMLILPDGTLSLYPTKETEKKERKKVFEVSEEKPEHLLRKLIGAYIAGYEVIEVRAKHKLNREIRDAVRRFTQTVIGPEIVDETISSVSTKDLLNPSDLPFDTSIRRMFYIVRGMHENAILALVERDHPLCEDVKSRDQEVDKLNWLIARQYNMLLTDSSFCGKMKMTRDSGLVYVLISRILERVGDHATKISYFIPYINSKIDKSLLEGIENIGKLSIELLDNSMDSFFKKNIKEANVHIDEVEILFEKCDSLMGKIASIKNAKNVALSQIIESIRRTGAYARDIAEMTINYSI